MGTIYRELKFEFVNCMMINGKNHKHNQIQDGGCCVDCIGFYEDLTDGVLMEFNDLGRKISPSDPYEVWDMFEVTNDDGDFPHMFKFGAVMKN